MKTQASTRTTPSSPTSPRSGNHHKPQTSRHHQPNEEEEKSILLTAISFDRRHHLTTSEEAKLSLIRDRHHLCLSNTFDTTVMHMYCKAVHSELAWDISDLAAERETTTMNFITKLSSPRRQHPLSGTSTAVSPPSSSCLPPSSSTSSSSTKPTSYHLHTQKVELCSTSFILFLPQQPSPISFLLFILC